jgi:hypothetical protein
MNAWREETMSSQVTTAACRDTKEPNPEDMKSKVEHQEVPVEDPLCSSGMQQGTQASETWKRLYGTESPEGTDVQDETPEGPRM